jgi:hypothetical protein
VRTKDQGTLRSTLFQMFWLPVWASGRGATLRAALSLLVSLESTSSPCPSLLPSPPLPSGVLPLLPPLEGDRRDRANRQLNSASSHSSSSFRHFLQPVIVPQHPSHPRSLPHTALRAVDRPRHRSLVMAPAR